MSDKDMGFMDRLPATAGPAPTFYNNAEGEIEKVVLDMQSLAIDEAWHLAIEPEGDHLKLRGYKDER